MKKAKKKGGTLWRPPQKFTGEKLRLKSRHLRLGFVIYVYIHDQVPPPFVPHEWLDLRVEENELKIKANTKKLMRVHFVESITIFYTPLNAATSLSCIARISFSGLFAAFENERSSIDQAGIKCKW